MVIQRNLKKLYLITFFSFVLNKKQIIQNYYIHHIKTFSFTKFEIKENSKAILDYPCLQESTPFIILTEKNYFCISFNIIVLDMSIGN
jgi:hypothetical protein